MRPWHRNRCGRERDLASFFPIHHQLQKLPRANAAQFSATLGNDPRDRGTGVRRQTERLHQRSQFPSDDEDRFAIHEAASRLPVYDFPRL